MSEDCTEPVGRPEFEPTAEQREEVEILVAGKFAEESIAARLGISRTTLLKHFRDEIDRGFAKRNGDALVMLYRKGVEGNASALRLWFARLEQTYAPPRAHGFDDADKREPLGKKEQAILAANNPDANTPMGALIAKRIAQETQH